MERPSERFVLIHRLFTFLDEWLFYAVLLILWFSAEYAMFGMVLVVGTIFNSISYKRYWAMERAMLNKEEENSDVG